MTAAPPGVGGRPGDPAGAPPSDTRTRILEAAVACIGRSGLARTSLEDVAGEAGVSRATLYRWFAGGRDQLIQDTMVWEMGQFLARVADALESEKGLEDKLVRGLVFGHRAIDDHVLLQRMLSTEPELFLTEFKSALPVLEDLVQQYLVELLGDETLRPGVDRAEAATYVSRLFLSYLGSQGLWDLSDESSARRLVQAQLLAGVLFGAAGLDEPT